MEISLAALGFQLFYLVIMLVSFAIVIAIVVAIFQIRNASVETAKRLASIEAKLVELTNKD